MTLYPSGTQYEISCGDAQATVSEVGASLRTFTLAQTPVLESFPLTAMADGAHGALLAPWPNRIAAGQYQFDGELHQLPITEPDKGNAIHGLVRWIPWRLHDHATRSVSLDTTIFPQPGYPFILHLCVTYEVSRQGLQVRTTATNEGDIPCPYALGHHPYFATASLAESTLRAPAETYLTLDQETLIPNGMQQVAGTTYDFRAGAEIGDKVLDTCLTDLGDNPVITFGDPQGQTSTLTLDENYRYLQLFTGDTLAPNRRRHSLAMEPMTAAPNAFVTDPAGVTLSPHESRTSEWRVEHS